MSIKLCTKFVAIIIMFVFLKYRFRLVVDPVYRATRIVIECYSAIFGGFVFEYTESEMGSEGTLDGNIDEIMKKYKKYKNLCKELLSEIEIYIQKEERVERKFSLETFKVTDLETENHQLSEKVTELEKLHEAQKKDYTKPINDMSNEIIQLHGEKKDMELIKNLNDELGKEVMTLTLNTQELSLSKNVAEEKLVQMQTLGSTLVNEECQSWWCAKHSKLAEIHTKLNPTTSVEKQEIKMALQRQYYWSQNNEIRCCVKDRKTGQDKHFAPPQCWVEYMAKNIKNDKMSIAPVPIFSPSLNDQNYIISDSLENET